MNERRTAPQTIHVAPEPEKLAKIGHLDHQPAASDLYIVGMRHNGQNIDSAHNKALLYMSS